MTEVHVENPECFKCGYRYPLDTECGLRFKPTNIEETVYRAVFICGECDPEREC